jgi:hypothetical protein
MQIRFAMLQLGCSPMKKAAHFERPNQVKPSARALIIGAFGWLLEQRNNPAQEANISSVRPPPLSAHSVLARPYPKNARVLRVGTRCRASGDFTQGPTPLSGAARSARAEVVMRSPCREATHLSCCSGFLGYASLPEPPGSEKHKESPVLTAYSRYSDNASRLTPEPRSRMVS